MPSFSCPRCLDRSLARPDAHEVRACGGCHGAWLPAATARRLIEEPFGPLAGLPAIVTRNAALRCPECRAELRRHRVADVEIDVCPEHGAWFDHREVERVQSAARQRHRGPGAELAAGVVVAVATAVYAPPLQPSAQRPGDSSGVVLDVAVETGDLALSAGDAVSSVAEIASAVVTDAVSSGESVTVVVEVATSGAAAASGVFEALVELLGGVFDGL